jgi:hypothetical protein
VQITWRCYRGRVVAHVKICPSCGNENPSNQSFCAKVECGFVLADVEITVAQEAAVEAAVAPTISDAVEITQPAGTWREPPSSEQSHLTATLTFPWGNVRIEETLLVGRENSPLADHLEHLGYVSRAHAEVYVEKGKLYVRDLHSTNHTYVNGDKIGTQPVTLTDGDEVAFSRHLIARVRLS